jgi:hypothetical protein
MTRQKHLKQLVRARMEKTGERYAAARRHVIDALPHPTPARGPDSHLAGSVPATTALRSLLAAAGVTAPHTGLPFDEAMLFGIAGGIGIGVFSFLYEKENFASFFIGGRHRWHDDQAYLEHAFTRLGVTTKVRESSGASTAEKALHELLEDGAPCIAWVEMGLLPHRAAPDAVIGSGYHVVTIHGIDDAAQHALVGDVTEAPIPVPLAVLADARGRIRKMKHRLMAIEAVGPTPPIATLVREGIAACHAGLLGEGAVASARGNFTLDAIGAWATRLRATKGKDAWVTVYPPGRRLWLGLTMLHDFVEHYGTGGGLCRPMFAGFLARAAEATGDASLSALGARYAALGQAWSELAHAALPDAVPLLAEARELLVRRAELVAGRWPESRDELAAVRARLQAVAGEAAARFPLDDTGCAALREALARRVSALHADEVAAHEAMGAWLAGAHA